MAKTKPQSPPRDDTAHEQTAAKDRSNGPEKPRQVVRDAPLRVRLAWEALEAAGFPTARNAEELGKHFLIECCLPSARSSTRNDSA
jgi:hypothetical protein